MQQCTALFLGDGVKQRIVRGRIEGYRLGEERRLAANPLEDVSGLLLHTSEPVLIFKSGIVLGTEDKLASSFRCLSGGRGESRPKFEVRPEASHKLKGHLESSATLALERRIVEADQEPRRLETENAIGILGIVQTHQLEACHNRRCTDTAFGRVTRYSERDVLSPSDGISNANRAWVWVSAFYMSVSASRGSSPPRQPLRNRRSEKSPRSPFK